MSEKKPRTTCVRCKKRLDPMRPGNVCFECNDKRRRSYNENFDKIGKGINKNEHFKWK